MSQILENIYIAGVEETYRDEKLKANVTHFLNVASEVMISERVNHGYMKIAIEDDDYDSNIRDILPVCIAWLRKVIDEGGCVCIHCLEGKSRSVCICIGYLCVSLGISYDEAYEMIKKKRECIDVFPLYEKQLRDWIKTI